MNEEDGMNTLFAKKLSSLLETKKISQNKLANDIGIDRASIGKYLRSESSPRLNTFLSICKALEVQPNYFLNPDYNDYSTDESKSQERKIIESIYCLAEVGIIRKTGEYEGCSFPYTVDVYNYNTLSTIIDECLRYAPSDLADDVHMCKKIADKYESELIKYFEETGE